MQLNKRSRALPQDIATQFANEFLVYTDDYGTKKDITTS